MSKTETTRRKFLEATSVAGGVCLMGRHGLAPARAEASRQVTVFTRPNIKSLRPDGPEIAALRRGVAAMKSRRFDDPTSWTYQAAIHGVSSSYFYWNQCKHGNWWFLPWHRMYLHYFERILRAASGDDGLALPYWGWDDPRDASQRAIPVAFRVPNSVAGNALYDDWRDPALNRAQRPALLSDYNPGYALEVPDFIQGRRDGFGGQEIGPITSPQGGHARRAHGALERYPHDPIHTQVGGLFNVNGRIVNGHMGLPETAARDPLFWLHHANIDRLWKVWHRRDPRRHLDPTDNSTWMEQSFLFFDESKAEVRKSVADVLDTVADLGYRYDDDPETEPGPSPLRARRPEVARQEGHPVPDHQEGEASLGAVVAEAAANRAELGARPTTVSLPLRREAEAAVDRIIRADIDREAEAQSLLLVVEGIKFDVDPGAPYGVYLNLPDVDIRPCNDDVHFAGALSFFGLHGHAQPALDKKAPVPNPDEEREVSYAGGGDLVLDVTNTARTLGNLDQWDGKTLKVTFIRHDPVSPDGRQEAVKAAAVPKATFERVSLRYSGQDDGR